MSSGLPSYLLILFFTIFGVLIGILVGFFLAYRWLSRLLNLKIKDKLVNKNNSNYKINNIVFIKNYHNFVNKFNVYNNMIKELKRKLYIINRLLSLIYLAILGYFSSNFKNLINSSPKYNPIIFDKLRNIIILSKICITAYFWSKVKLSKKVW